MISPNYIFWEVDMQRDFVLPGGHLYVPGAERLLAKIRKLTDAARQGKVFLVSSGDFHAPNDPEFKTFPPHCIKGEPGSELVPEAITDKIARVENTEAADLPKDIFQYQQILLEKQTLDVFQTRHAGALVDRLGRQPEFVVFGVVTEYCVNCAVTGLLQRGRRVAVVTDGIETLNKDEGDRTVSDWQRLGARLTTTDQALNALSH